MRALLIVNPKATTTNARVLDVIVSALGSALQLEVATTEAQGHGVQLAAQAARNGVGLVVTLGGDGTVNEAVNGLLAAGPSPDGPALATVPGGNANVFARTLGLPRDPVEATADLLGALREGRRRTISLGRVGERWFTFCAGVGLDAEVIRRVEQSRDDGHRASSVLYIRSALRHFVTGSDRRRAALRLERPGAAPIGGLHLIIVSNSAPWTFVGSIPIQPTPEASFDTGLDVLALHRLGVASTLRVVRRMLIPAGGPPRGRNVLALHDQAGFTVTAARPVAYQVDGDYVDLGQHFAFTSVPDALTVLA